MTADALAQVCDGCGAEVGESCRPGCLSHVTDDTGQPITEGEQ